jgi:hypothetical protein
MIICQTFCVGFDHIIHLLWNSPAMKASDHTRNVAQCALNTLLCLLQAFFVWASVQGLSLTPESLERGSNCCWNWHKWESESTNESGPSFVCSLGLSCRDNKFFILPSLLQSAQYKIFLSSPYTISIHMSPSPSKVGRQSWWVACLLVCCSLWHFNSKEKNSLAYHPIPLINRYSPCTLQFLSQNIGTTT